MPDTIGLCFAAVTVAVSAGGIDSLLSFATRIAAGSAIAWVVIGQHGFERNASARELLQSVALILINITESTLLEARLRLIRQGDAALEEKTA
jgi:hypothetical protein